MAPVTGQRNLPRCHQDAPEVWVDAQQAASIHTEKDTRGTQTEGICRRDIPLPPTFNRHFS